MKKSELKKLIREVAEEVNVRSELIKFFTNTKEPNDDLIHNLSDKLGIDTHKFEGEIYKLLSDFFAYGRYNEKGRKTVPAPEELKLGMEIEMEHTNCKEIAKRIALDHLSEMNDYYTKLKEMESSE